MGKFFGEKELHWYIYTVIIKSNKFRERELGECLKNKLWDLQFYCVLGLNVMLNVSKYKFALASMLEGKGR